MFGLFKKKKKQKYIPEAIKDFDDLILMDEGPHNEYEQLYLDYKKAERVYRHYKRKVERYPRDKKGHLWDEWCLMVADDINFQNEQKVKNKRKR